MMNLILWFLLLVLQNAAFTWVSRARNSGSIGYHAIAAVFSNGIPFDLHGCQARDATRRNNTVWNCLCTWHGNWLFADALDFHEVYGVWQ
jgi:hypothetical protein